MKPPSPASAVAAKTLHGELHAAGFNADSILDRLGKTGPPLPKPLERAWFLEQTNSGGALNMLLRLFFLGEAQGIAESKEALKPSLFETLLEVRLLVEDVDKVVPNAHIIPFGELLICADFYHRMQSDERYDHVLSVNATAQYLSRFTLRNKVGRTLDLGCGGGLQALACASHSKTVVASDLNARACEFGRFNAWLNGFSNIDFRTGDLFAPMQGEQFDLIVCNPPFVMAPGKDFLYRDNDLVLDGLCEKVVRQVPQFLEDGGHLQMICEWAACDGVEWKDKLQGWFKNSGCDVWVQANVRKTPAAYAHGWLKAAADVNESNDPEEFNQWMDYYRHNKVDYITSGLILMRKRSGKNWTHFQEQPEHIAWNFGEAVERRIELFDALDNLESDAELLQAYLIANPNARLTQTAQPSQGAWNSGVSQLSLDDEIPASINVQPQIANFLAQFDGKKQVQENLELLAASSGVGAEQMRTEVLQVVKLLLQHGFLKAVAHVQTK